MTLPKPDGRLKVYSGSLGGTHQVIMACNSILEFCKATGCNRNYVYGRTSNPDQVRQAMSAPGIAFKMAYNGRGNRWIAMGRR